MFVLDSSFRAGVPCDKHIVYGLHALTHKRQRRYAKAFTSIPADLLNRNLLLGDGNAGCKRTGYEQRDVFFVNC